MQSGLFQKLMELNSITIKLHSYTKFTFKYPNIMLKLKVVHQNKVKRSIQNSVN